MIKLKSLISEQSPSFNKWLLKFTDDYFGDYPKGSPEYQWALATLFKSTLVDANFHKESKLVDKIFPKQEEPDGYEKLEKLISYKADEVAKKAKWEGDDIIDGFGYVAAMRIGGSMLPKIQSLKS